MRQTLFVGDFRFPEFLRAVEVLRDHSWLALAIDIDDALTRVQKQGLLPELIVLAQSHPGQFAHPAVEKLHHAVPLARLVSVLGSWSGSETRTGQPCPGVMRTYWHQFPSRFDLAFLHGRANGHWELPKTSSDAERTLSQLGPGAKAGAGRLVVVRASQLATYQVLADALAGDGYATTWATGEERAFVSGHWAGIWDCGTLLGDELQQLSRFTQDLDPAPVIAIASFPRLAQRRQLIAAGASEVLGKPFSLGDLLELVGRGQPDASAA